MASATGITWYHRDHYPAVLALFRDDSLPATYDEWLRTAKELERNVLRGGGRVVRAYVDPVEFPQWCQRTGNKIDASGRMAFGIAFAAETVASESAAATRKTKTWKLPDQL